MFDCEGVMTPWEQMTEGDRRCIHVFARDVRSVILPPFAFLPNHTCLFLG
jgi:hypothetical protein